MLSELKSLLGKHEDVDEDAIKMATSALLSRQFLYRAKGLHRRHFETVTRFQRYFYNLMDAVGHQLLVEEKRGFVGIVPINYTRMMSLDETLLLFAFRFFYDEEISSFNADQDGSVNISVEDFELRYEGFTQRTLPRTKGEFQQLLATFIRYGIVEYGPDENSPEIECLHILPSITALLTGDVTKRIEMYMKASDIETQAEEDGA